MTIFGVHVGLQSTTVDDLRRTWRSIEDMGYSWISVWDHFYGATGRADDYDCLESTAMHAALACSTSRVEIGCLVYSIGYRHPAVLAKSITAIDLLSGGRAAMGIGAGWSKLEYDAYGFEFAPVKVRMDQLEEGLHCVRSLLHEEVTTFEGTWFQMREARNEPRPAQTRIPIWVGGGGEQRTLRIAAKYADGWNVPFVPPEMFAHKNRVLDEHCEKVGRDPKQIRRAINVGLAFTEENLRHQFGEVTEFVRPGVLNGSNEQILDRIGQYVDAGAEQVNIAIRAPFDLDAIGVLAEVLRLPGNGA